MWESMALVSIHPPILPISTSLLGNTLVCIHLPILAISAIELGGTKKRAPVSVKPIYCGSSPQPWRGSGPAKVMGSRAWSQVCE